MTKTDQISICILTYNRPVYLKSALQSVLAQSILPFEVIIVDDGSGPETEETISALSQNSLPLRHIWQQNSGHSSARNRAVAECKTPYLMWLDDDDALTENALETQLHTISARSQADIIYGDLLFCHADLSPDFQMLYKEIPKRLILHEFIGGNQLPNPGTAIKKSVFDLIGLYDVSFRHTEDYDLFARAASAGLNFAHNKNFVCKYRMHEGNLAEQKKLRRLYPENIMVVERMLERHTIEDLFPDEPWDTLPEQAMGQSCTEIATILLRQEGYPQAAELLRKLSFTPQAGIAHFLSRLIEEFAQHSLAGLEGLSSERLYFSEESQRFVDIMLANLNQLQLSQAFRTRVLDQRLATEAIEDIFPQHPWKSNPEHAWALSCVDIALYYARAGAFEKVQEILSQGRNDADKQLFTYLSSLLTTYRQDGINAVFARHEDALFNNVVSLRFVSALIEEQQRQMAVT